MTIPLARTVRKLKQAISRRLPQRRDDSGLTTLEWLLIVAAVAGLAALAVVLVSQVVSDTSEDIAGQSARLTAAQLAADGITDRASDLPATSVDELVKWVQQRRDFERRCERLTITYGDVDQIADVVWNQEDPNAAMTDLLATGPAWVESLDADTPGTDDGCQISTT